MSIWNIALLLDAVIAAALAWRVPRALLWIGAAAADYAVSVIYWRLNLPYAEAVAGMCDAAVCLSIYFVYRERWELVIYRLFQASLLVNILFLMGNLAIIPSVSQDTYASVLEVLNWLTLLLIGGMGVAQRVGASGAFARRPAGGLDRALFSLRASRKTPSFHRLR